VAETPTEISEAIRMLDDRYFKNHQVLRRPPNVKPFTFRHRQQILELRQRMDTLQREYLSERQSLSNKLLNAIQSQQVCVF